MTTAGARPGNSPPKRKFKYLKRGEGTARFGILGKPPEFCQEAKHCKSRETVEPIELEDPKSWPIRSKFTLLQQERLMAASASAPVTARSNNNDLRTIGSDSGCEDTPISASDRGYQPSPQSVSMSDTHQFERLERDLVGDASISGDSTFYRQFTSNVHKFPDRRKSSPRITEIQDDDNHSGSSRSAAGGDKKSPPSKPHDESIESGRISSLKTVSERSEPVATATSSGPSSGSLPKIPSFQQISAPDQPGPSRILPNLPRPPPLPPSAQPTRSQQQQQQYPQFSGPIRPNAGFPLHASSPVGLGPEVDKLIGVLRARLALFDRDYGDFKERERDAMERFEMQKLSLIEYGKELDSKRQLLEKERADFEQFKSNEISEIRKARETVEKQKNIVCKKESEQVKILKEQIVDLQNDICERDSRCSSQRAKIRELELRISKINSDLKDAKADIQRGAERTRSLEDTNAQLRLKLGTINSRITGNNGAPSRILFKTPDSVDNGAGKKSVRFDFDSGRNSAGRKESERWDFMRTDNRETQTSFLSPAPASPTAETAVKNLGSPSDHMIDIDRTLLDGSRETIYRNGTTRLLACDGVTVTLRYRNGDSRRILSDGTEIYCYSDKGVTHVTEPSGERIVRFADGREERHLPDGTKTVRTGDKETVSSPDGQRVESYSDGTRLIEQADGVTTVFFKDGSKETRCQDFTRREWPNGEVKIVYSDGTVESKYKDGRVRIKDSQGCVLRDEYIAG